MFNHMVERQSAVLDAVFHSLADATRREMLGILTQGERSVGQLAEPFAMSLAAASKHIQQLERAGLIRREIRGRTHYCSLADQPLGEAQRWIEQCRAFWEERLVLLESVLDEEHGRPAGRRKMTTRSRK